MAEERKGLFTKEQESKLAKIADSATKLNNPMLEALDGIVFKQAIALLDNLVFEKIPQETQAMLEPIIDEIVDALPDELVD